MVEKIMIGLVLAVMVGSIDAPQVYGKEDHEKRWNGMTTAVRARRRIQNATAMGMAGMGIGLMAMRGEHMVSRPSFMPRLQCPASVSFSRPFISIK